MSALEYITFFVILVLIFVNGLTDAPNAIATLVATKAMSFRKAAYMSATFDFIGVIVMSFVNLSVADCISSMVDLSDTNLGVLSLCCSMASVIIFSMIAMLFGIPTSESHGLIAGLTGTALAINGINGVNFIEWLNVIIGLAWSLLGGFTIGYIVLKVVDKILKKASDPNIRKGQILSTCGISFMHGAQDGQKFIGVLVIFVSLINGMQVGNNINPFDYFGFILIVAITMAAGVSVGGYRIVKSVGEEMVVLDNKEALSSDVATISTLMIASLTGLPVSTTHVKTATIVGAGKSSEKGLNKLKVTNIVKAWFCTFPVCGLISYIVMLILKNIVL